MGIIKPKKLDFKKSRWKAVYYGWAFSLVWLSILLLILLDHYIFEIPKDGVMPPNELGDTFAGFFGALAFFWLVLGYFQQGKELELQRKELSNSVEQLSRQGAGVEESVRALSAQTVLLEKSLTIQSAENIISVEKYIQEQLNHILTALILNEESIETPDNWKEFPATAKARFVGRILSPEDFDISLISSKYFLFRLENYVETVEYYFDYIGRMNENRIFRQNFEMSVFHFVYVCAKNIVSDQKKSEGK